MATAEDYAIAAAAEATARKLTAAFDDKAEELDVDRRAWYAALILLTETFCKNSETDVDTILADFCRRVKMGVEAKKATRQ